MYSFIWLVLITTPIYLFLLTIQRLYLSPIARVPGPKLAALTYWYEFYHDCFHRGQYLFKIQELHRKYGPIVRINPAEVHINDIAFYDTIYAPGSSKHPRDKIRFQATDQDNMFDTYDSELHRQRRAAVASSFSKQSIRALEPAIRSIVDDLTERLGKLAEGPNDDDNKIVKLDILFNNVTQEVIGQYCFGTDSMSQLRGSSDFAFLNPAHSFAGINAWGRMFPWAMDLFDKLPFGLLGALYPDSPLAGLQQFDARVGAQIERVLRMDAPAVGARNVFHEMRDGKHLPAADRHFGYYKNEAASILGGGTHTTASALLTAAYHVVKRPELLGKVREELRGAMKDGDGELPPLATLETLPYLTAVIQEGLRLSFGVPGRLPRTAPKEELVYEGYKLPPGTVISSSSYLYHTNEAVFPSPYAFEPERWLRDPSALRHSFVPFSRGGRGCIGINLAYAELYLVLAGFFTRLEVALHETTDRDVEIVEDNFVGLRPSDSKGVRVKVLKDLRGVTG
ncbi:cytochrome P450 [Xylariomycetidae sp. FL2044]|nr:cytochrome P450 [Xylariomycetidae sp. FL2044]